MRSGRLAIGGGGGSSSISELTACAGLWYACWTPSTSVGVVLLGLELDTRLSDEPVRDFDDFTIESVGISGILPECVVVFAFVMNLVFGGSFDELSYQFSTSNTACGLFFCSCLLMFECINSLDHASGIPYKEIKGDGSRFIAGGAWK